MTEADIKLACDLAVEVTSQTGPNVFGSASWFRVRATSLAEAVSALVVELDARGRESTRLAQALGEALEIADGHVNARMEIMQGISVEGSDSLKVCDADLYRIAELRALLARGDGK